LSLPTEYEDFPVNGTSYIAGSYVQWVESGGARVVPIPIDADISEISKIIQSVNGVLFTGGSAPFFTNDGQPSNYTSVGCFIFDLIKQLNDGGIYYPLWSTCLGYELINVCVSSYPATISSFNGEPSYAAKINFTQEAINATLFDTDQGDWIRSIQQHQSINLFSHEHGVAPSTYFNSTLSQFYKVLATGRDLNNTEYIALIEARDYPIYGNQYHPEKNVFEWTTSSPIPHNATAVASTSYYSSYFVAEARRNDLSFGSESALKPYLIYNYQPYFLDGYFDQIYVF
jgi:gamma-glutamyl hydrolase